MPQYRNRHLHMKLCCCFFLFPVCYTPKTYHNDRVTVLFIDTLSHQISIEDCNETRENIKQISKIHSNFFFILRSCQFKLFFSVLGFFFVFGINFLYCLLLNFKYLKKYLNSATCEKFQYFVSLKYILTI